MLQMFKDIKDVQRKERYLDAMDFLAKAIKEATDKNPTEKVLKMGDCMREIMIYNTKLEMENDDLKFADSVRVGRMRRLVETIEYYEKKLEHLEKQI
jgi:Ethanolamine utilization protein EutJ (predicted chaperonin)